MQRYAYTPHPQFPVGMPLVELQLSYASYKVTASALVDSGAALNILPFDTGIELGLDWEPQNFPLDLGGTLTENYSQFSICSWGTASKSPSVVSRVKR